MLASALALATLGLANDGIQESMFTNGWCSMPKDYMFIQQ
jgi:hypothetical protein